MSPDSIIRAGQRIFYSLLRAEVQGRVEMAKLDLPFDDTPPKVNDHAIVSTFIGKSVGLMRMAGGFNVANVFFETR